MEKARTHSSPPAAASSYTLVQAQQIPPQAATPGDTSQRQTASAPAAAPSSEGYAPAFRANFLPYRSMKEAQNHRSSLSSHAGPLQPRPFILTNQHPALTAGCLASDYGNQQAAPSPSCVSKSAALSKPRHHPHDLHDEASDFPTDFNGQHAAAALSPAWQSGGGRHLGTSASQPQMHAPGQSSAQPGYGRHEQSNIFTSSHLNQLHSPAATNSKQRPGEAGMCSRWGARPPGKQVHAKLNAAPGNVGQQKRVKPPSIHQPSASIQRPATAQSYRYILESQAACILLGTIATTAGLRFCTSMTQQAAAHASAKGKAHLHKINRLCLCLHAHTCCAQDSIGSACIVPKAELAFHCACNGLAQEGFDAATFVSRGARSLTAVQSSECSFW